MGHMAALSCALSGFRFWALSRCCKGKRSISLTRVSCGSQIVVQVCLVHGSQRSVFGVDRWGSSLTTRMSVDANLQDVGRMHSRF